MHVVSTRSECSLSDVLCVMFLRVNHPRDGMVKQSLVIKNDNIPPISIAHGEREKKCAKSGAGPHTVRKWSPNQPRMDVLVKFAFANAGACVWCEAKYTKKGLALAPACARMKPVVAATYLPHKGACSSFGHKMSANNALRTYRRLIAMAWVAG